MGYSNFQTAIQGTYHDFPEDQRTHVDVFTQEYPARYLLRDGGVNDDLGDVFNKILAATVQVESESGIILTDDNEFDIFNLTLVKLTNLAFISKEFRKEIGVKKVGSRERLFLENANAFYNL